jgi:hypothetical protein
MCNREFEEDVKENIKVMDHNHFTGLYRGPAHYKCNLACHYNEKTHIPAIIHNFKGYDSHFLI